MSAKIQAYAATRKGGKLQPFEFDPGPLGDDQVEIKVSLLRHLPFRSFHD